MYFVDARLDTLDVMRYDGSKRRTILKSGLIKHPFGMAIFEDYLYFTDWSPGYIRRLSRRDGSSKMVYREQLTKPMGIQVHTPLCFSKDCYFLLFFLTNNLASLE